jgi:hypothetical protein
MEPSIFPRVRIRKIMDSSSGVRRSKQQLRKQRNFKWCLNIYKRNTVTEHVHTPLWEKSNGKRYKRCKTLSNFICNSAYEHMTISQVHIFLTSALAEGVVSFMLRPLYPRYLLDRRLRGPLSRSGRRGEEKILDPIGTRTPTSRSSSPKPVAKPHHYPWHTNFIVDSVK